LDAELAGDHSDPARDVRDWEDQVNREDLRALHVEEGDVLVRDIMTPAVYSVREDASVEAMARTMVSGRIHRLFVTRQRRIVGIVTSLDLLKLLYEAPTLEVPTPRAASAGPGHRPSRRHRMGG
jgi:CBS domain-containing protein